MRTTLGRSGLTGGALLLLIALASPAGAKRPVTTPGGSPPPPPPPTAQPVPPPPPAAEGKRPVLAPGAKPPEEKKPPPPQDFSEPAAAAAPAAPPPPVAKPRPVDPNPPELRYRKKTGDFVFVMAVRPGKPKPGEPVEVVWTINEILPIPDPDLGDRRPLVKARLHATLSGPDGEHVYELHPQVDKGHYGFHFTPRKEGVFTLVCDRADAKPGMRTEFPLGVGVDTPVPVDADSDPDQRKGAQGARRVLGVAAEPKVVAKKPKPAPGAEETIEPEASSGPDDATLEGVMVELGKRWLELGRKAGGPSAQPLADRLREQAKKVEGKVPTGHGEGRDLFDKLARKMVEDLEGVKAVASDRARTEAAMLQIQNDHCLRCHAQYRLEIAANVARWPGFEVSKDLAPPAVTAPTKQKRRAKPKLGPDTRPALNFPGGKRQ